MFSEELGSARSGNYPIGGVAPQFQTIGYDEVAYGGNWNQRFRSEGSAFQFPLRGARIEDSPFVKDQRFE